MTSKMPINLFQSGEYRLHSGELSDYKLECDALTWEDLETLALIASKALVWKDVWPIPTGGTPFAASLKKYNTGEATDPLLIVDDVYTTGESMLKVGETALNEGHEIQGLVIFARRTPLWWVKALFQLTEDFQ